MRNRAREPSASLVQDHTKKIRKESNTHEYSVIDSFLGATDKVINGLVLVINFYLQNFRTNIRTGIFKFETSEATVVSRPTGMYAHFSIEKVLIARSLT